MPSGMEVYRADGSVQMTFTDRLSRVVGTMTITAAGSVTVNTAYGAPWAVIIPSSNANPTGVSISGSTISWTETSGLLVYGVY